jgi:putative PIN family toxin of toxin-antitoxin system
VKIALDTTILVRAHQKANGPARAVLLELLEAGHELLLSASILEELGRVLYYPRLLKKSQLTTDEVSDFLTYLSAASSLVDIDQNLPVLIQDPNDAHVLRCAIGGKADYLCTLDAHFYEATVIEFCASRGIQIKSDVEILRLIRGTSKS